AGGRWRIAGRPVPSGENVRSGSVVGAHCTAEVSMLGPPPVLDGEQWRAELAARFSGLVASPSHAHPEQAPMGRVRSIGLDDMSVHRISGTRQTLLRTAPAVRRRPSDLLKVCLMEQGRLT